VCPIETVVFSFFLKCKSQPPTSSIFFYAVRFSFNMIWTLVNASEVWIINSGEMGSCFQTRLTRTPYHLTEQQHLPWLHQFRFRWTSAHPITTHLVQSQRLSHTFFLFFWPALLEIFCFFFNHGPPLLTQLPRSKKIFPPTLLLYPCYRIFFFSYLSFFLPSLSMLQQWAIACCCLLLFCLCSTQSLVLIFFCFFYVHPKKTTTSCCSSSFFFVLFLCT